MVCLEYIHLLQVLSSLKLKPPVYLKGFYYYYCCFRKQYVVTNVLMNCAKGVLNDYCNFNHSFICYLLTNASVLTPMLRWTLQ